MSDKNYLSKLPDWSPETACQLAAQESLTFSEAHIEVLEAARQFFDQYGFHPRCALCAVRWLTIWA